MGSDITKYPYYLCSCEPILKSKDIANIVLSYFREYEDDYDYEEDYEDDDEIVVDDKITTISDSAKWLLFSECMNNGGTSKLYIDFTPSDIGKVGQIVRYLHDPDEIIVIADSFDDYLQMIMDNDYDFINEDTF